MPAVKIIKGDIINDNIYSFMIQTDLDRKDGSGKRMMSLTFTAQELADAVSGGKTKLQFLQERIRTEYALISAIHSDISALVGQSYTW